MVTVHSTLGPCMLHQNIRLPPLNNILECSFITMHEVTLENDSSFCLGTASQCHVKSFSYLLVVWAASPLMRLHLSCSQHFYLCAGPSSAPEGAFIFCLPCRMDCSVCTGHYFKPFVAVVCFVGTRSPGLVSWKCLFQLAGASRILTEQGSAESLVVFDTLCLPDAWL